MPSPRSGGSRPPGRTWSRFPTPSTPAWPTPCGRAASRRSTATRRRRSSCSPRAATASSVTPTASGKTLCYNLPVLQALLDEPAARALYLFPTKALAQDQLAELEALAQALPELRIHTYDGDTPQDARRAVRARANVVLTNPDMLHAGILPHHTKWVALFQNLRYVIIDELHTYRGVFGSHLANLLRRLQRICRHYGSTPQFICASATIANPRELAERLIGQPVGLVDENGAPAGEKWSSSTTRRWSTRSWAFAGRTSRRRPAGHAVPPARVPTIVFTGSRLAEEVLLTDLKAAVERAPAFADVIRGYRGGYLPGRRREVERGLREGDVLGVVSTNALELGIDIGRLDVAVLAGYPGTLASTWQQAGRAGRRSGLAAAVLVASSAPLDQFIVTHPDYFFGAPPEHGLVNPDNPYVLVSHLKCAAFELPFADGERFGDRGHRGVPAPPRGGGAAASRRRPLALDERELSRRPPLAPDGRQRQLRGHRHHAPDLERRSVRRLTRKRQVIAEVDWRSAFGMIHPKAIYLIEGSSSRSRSSTSARTRRRSPTSSASRSTTSPTRSPPRASGRSTASATGATAPGRPGGAGRAARRRAGGRVQEDQVRHDGERRRGGGRAPPAGDAHGRSLADRAVRGAGRGQPRPRRAGRRAPRAHPSPPPPGAALPHVRRAGPGLLARRRSARRDAAGRDAAAGAARVLTADGTRARLLRAERFAPTLYLYDNQPGGIGLSERLFEVLGPLVVRARETLRACPCQAGCPSCVGPVNQVGRQAKPSPPPSSTACGPDRADVIDRSTTTLELARLREIIRRIEVRRVRIRPRGGRRRPRSPWSASRRRTGSPSGAPRTSRGPRAPSGRRAPTGPCSSTRRPRGWRAGPGPTSSWSGWPRGRRTASG